MKEMPETCVRSLGRKDTLEEGMAIHSSIHACEIHWTEEPSRLHFIESQRIGHDWGKIIEELDGYLQKCKYARIHWMTMPMKQPCNLIFSNLEQFHFLLLFPESRLGQGGGGGVQFGLVLIRSAQPRSLTCAIYSRVCAPMKIQCFHWSDRRQSSGSNVSDMEQL